MLNACGVGGLPPMVIASEGAPGPKATPLLLLNPYAALTYN